MRRLLTAAVAVPLALLATFKLPQLGVLRLPAADLRGLRASSTCSCCGRTRRRAAVGGAVRRRAAAAAGAVLGARAGTSARCPPTPGCSPALLLCHRRRRHAAAARPHAAARRRRRRWGSSASASPTSPLPVAVASAMQRLDPWLLFLLYAIVWLGDTAAFYVGSAWGRHKMAPVVSPNKSWEGAIAGFLTGIVATALWSWLRLGEAAAAAARGGGGDRGGGAARRPLRVAAQARRQRQGLRAARCPGTAASSTAWTPCCSPGR